MRDLVDKKERERRNQQVKKKNEKKAQDYKIVVEIKLHGIIINVHHVTHDFQSFLQLLHFAFN